MRASPVSNSGTTDFQETFTGTSGSTILFTERVRVCAKQDVVVESTLQAAALNSLAGIKSIKSRDLQEMMKCH